MVAAEHRAQRRRHPAASRPAPVQRAGQEPRPLVRLPSDACTTSAARPLVQPLPRLLITGNGLPGASGKPEMLADPPHKRRLQNGQKIGGHRHRTASRSWRMRPWCARFLSHPPARSTRFPARAALQPGRARRARSGPITKRIICSFGQPLARHHAAPQRAGLRLVLDPSVVSADRPSASARGQPARQP